MDKRIANTLNEIRDQYGDMVFYNHQKTKNLMHDLAPGLHRERIHIGQFLELNGYFQLKYAGHSFPIIRARLVQNYASTYAVNEKVAEWVLDVFSEVLGYSDFKNMDKMIISEATELLPLFEEDTPINEMPPRFSPTNKVKPDGHMSGDCPLSGGERHKIPRSPSKTTDSRSRGLMEEMDGVSPGLIGKAGFSLADLKKRISADMHSVCVLPDGKVIAVGPNEEGQCNVGNWRDIVAISAGPFFTVGLQKNGRVVACGRNEYGQCNVASWRNIVAISAGARHTVGLKADGTLVAVGQNRNGECNIENWSNIIHIHAGYLCTFGIKKDHKVLVKGNLKGSNLSVGHLSNVVDIANPYPYRSLALKLNGKLMQIGQEDTLQKSIDKWRNIKQISAGPDYFAGLFKNGTVRVLAYYWKSTGIECSPHDWQDIIAIAAGRFHLMGVKKDGSVVSAMMHPSIEMDKGQCRVQSWRLI